MEFIEEIKQRARKNISELSFIDRIIFKLRPIR